MSEMVSLTQKLINAALHAVAPDTAISRHLRYIDGVLWVGERSYDVIGKKLRLIAIGKASVPMAMAVLDLLGDHIQCGVIVTKYAHVTASAQAKIAQYHPKIRLIESAHPVPDENSLRAGIAVCAALENCSADTLVITCVSGGASALQVAPHEGISLKTMRAINDALLRSGADITEMNAVRSRLDRLKAGGLVRMAQPGQVVGLILSDVIGDPLAVIASGLTNDPLAYNVLVGNNAQACAAAASAVQKLGYKTQIVTTNMVGEARERGCEIVNEMLLCVTQLGRQCLIFGGETTVTIRGNGKGGRNQELALAAAIELAAHTPKRPITIISFGTDGTDGPTNAAGAIVTQHTLARSQKLGLNAQQMLAQNDSYHFFQPLGDLIITGPTGTNTADIVIALLD
ncbi:MAG: DUF4147 domain-containing protein [Chloroflexota bacterium]|jgi:hydroxypyruvate reductase|nr:DUF4147 domain-containing protein [Chloroflexota bacterium]